MKKAIESNRNIETNPEILMLGYLCVKDSTNIQEMVAILDRFSLNDQEIAKICNTTKATIRNARQRNKRK